METDLKIDVANLDDPHRRALEETIGRQLENNQRLLIKVTEVELPSGAEPRPTQVLADWTRVYEGLSEAEIESIDKIANTRADLTRNLP